MQESGRDENQELREEKDRLKKEVERLQNQLSQCMTLEEMQAALVIERQNMLKELQDSITSTGFPDTRSSESSSPSVKEEDDEGATTKSGSDSPESVVSEGEDSALKDKKVQVEEKKPLHFLYRVEKPVPRPPTPTVDVPPEGDEEKELAVIFLQKLLRGRSIQNQMLEGLEKHQELIQELRMNHTLQREEQELQREEKQVTQALQRQIEQSKYINSLFI
ncbi:hypothetical protein KOW79_004837 [Hemibagrus wyckioides]|uniref:Uncharacterized protein n=1 Tax=Hemibagrus wyckioides TaxID=337641 RepID=A0A9D3P0V6_9TELE|nr:hypothetical protein KOW79_004837 [Hemibagrus wyckioides]